MDREMATRSGLMRDYRKGNWTVQETMILIQAKKMDEERRMKRQGETSTERGKPSELRWKWVENYCWENGCLRSQNQCNDKWDNLMRDFKKVREYEMRVSEEEKSYWRIEKSERKDNNLPTNMLRQIYDALVEVVEKKGTQMVVVGGSGSTTGGGIAMEKLISFGQPPPPLPPLMQQPDFPASTRLLLPPPQAHTPPQPPTFPSSPPLRTTAPDSDTSDQHSDSPAKRRRRGRGGGGGEGASGAGTSGGNLQEVGTAISESASIIAQAIQSSEEKEERRHRELLSLHERRLQIEESKAEIKRAGINGIVDAINNLANSILDLASGHQHQQIRK